MFRVRDTRDHGGVTEVFLSYSRNQQAYARSLAEHLRQRGVPVWVDDDLVAGDRWERVIQERIDRCAALVVVMTPDAEESDWVRREVAWAQDRGKPVFPVLLEGRPLFRLSDVHAEDVRGGAMPGDRFVAALSRLVGTAAPSPDASPRLAWALGEPGRLDPLISLEFSRDGGRLLASYLLRPPVEWDLVTGQVLRVLDGDPAIRYAVYAFDGYLAFSGAVTGPWNRLTFRDADGVPIADRHFTWIRGVDWDEDTGRCAVLSDASRITEWSVRGDAPDWAGEYSGVESVFYRPDHRLSLVSRFANGLIVWDAHQGVETLRWDHLHPQYEVGRTWLTAIGSRELRIWSRSGVLERSCALPERPLWVWMTTDPLRRWLAAPGGPGEVHLHSLTSGNVEYVLPHGSPVVRPAFSPDGSTLAVGDDRGRVHFWRL